MKQQILKVTENVRIAENIWKMVLEDPALEEQKPGQFVNIRLDGLYLRRPISVCESDPGVLTGLGNGYDLSKSGDKPLLLGGGVGVPPLILLARKLREQGKNVTAVLGFNTKSEVFGEHDLWLNDCRVIVATADGSYGAKGFVTDAMPEDYSYFYTCGPEPMLKAVYKATKTSGQFSFEERMGCGFGACMGCSCKTITGYKRICREGPVLEKEEIAGWRD